MQPDSPGKGKKGTFILLANSYLPEPRSDFSSKGLRMTRRLSRVRRDPPRPPACQSCGTGAVAAPDPALWACGSLASETVGSVGPACLLWPMALTLDFMWKQKATISEAAARLWDRSASRETSLTVTLGVVPDISGHGS